MTGAIAVSASSTAWARPSSIPVARPRSGSCWPGRRRAARRARGSTGRAERRPRPSTVCGADLPPPRENRHLGAAPEQGIWRFAQFRASRYPSASPFGGTTVLERRVEQRWLTSRRSGSGSRPTTTRSSTSRRRRSSRPWSAPRPTSGGRCRCRPRSTATRSSARPTRTRTRREHFEMRVHKRLLDILEPSPEDGRLAPAPRPPGRRRHRDQDPAGLTPPAGPRAGPMEPHQPGGR